MNYWPVYSTNMTETALPLIDYVESLREENQSLAVFKIIDGLKDILEEDRQQKQPLILSLNEKLLIKTVNTTSFPLREVLKVVMTHTGQHRDAIRVANRALISGRQMVIRAPESTQTPGAR